MSSAATGARDQVARLLALVPYLHAQGGAESGAADGVRLDQAARDLGVSEQQLVKDLKVLFLCGLPGGYPDDLIDVDLDALVEPGGDRVIRVSNADYLSRPLRLTPTEATAIIVALRALRGGATDPAVRDVVDRTLAKLEQAAAEGSVTTVDPGEEAPDPAQADQGQELRELRRTLDRAVADRRQLRLVYFVPSRDEESERVVDPLAVVRRGGADYLDAWCHSAEAPRLFRLDRIRSAELLDTAVAGERTASAMAESLFTSGAGLGTATLLVAPAALWITEYFPVTAVRRLPADGDRSGWVEVDLPVADERWLRRLVLRLQPDVTVLTPGTLMADVADTAAAALLLYGEAVRADQDAYT